MARLSPFLQDLKADMLRKGITYRLLGERAGVSWSFVYKVMNKQRRSAVVIREACRLTGRRAPREYQENGR